MSIGSTIKRLRRARDITQEELAEHLGITSKAISQWETNRTAPDISQLPALCNYFDITSDELLGIDVAQKNAERDRLTSEVFRLAKNGYDKEAWELLKEGLQRFPNDYSIMGWIINRSFFALQIDAFTEAEKDEIREDCRRYSERILESCNDDMERHRAINYLVEYYAEKGNTEKAEEFASKMPIICLSRDFLRTKIYKGDDRIALNQCLIYNLIQNLDNYIGCNYKTSAGEKFYTPDEMAALRDKKIALLELMFEDDNLGFYHCRLTTPHRHQARYYAKQNNKEKVLHHLTKAVDAAIAFLQFMENENFVHTSLLFRGMESSAGGVMLSQSDNEASLLLEELKREDYAFLGDDPALSDLRTRLDHYAGKNRY